MNNKYKAALVCVLSIFCVAQNANNFSENNIFTSEENQSTKEISEIIKKTVCPTAGYDYDYFVENDFHFFDEQSLKTHFVNDFDVMDHNDDYVWFDFINSKSVSDVTGGNPIEGIPNTANAEMAMDRDVVMAKSRSKLKNFEYVGCGPMAASVQIDYLARYCGYTQFASNIENHDLRTKLFIDIFNTIDVVPLTELNIKEGTGTYPVSLIYGLQQIFKDYNITSGVGCEALDENGYLIPPIKIYGDLIEKKRTKEEQILLLNKSIDNGMPVIWYTPQYFGYFAHHYMNIIGYENWHYRDSENRTQSHLMYKVLMNWGLYENEGIPFVYMDSDLLGKIESGFIFMEETAPRTFINDEEYNFPCEYSKQIIESNINVSQDEINIRRFRTGYIDELGTGGNGEKFLTLSPKRKHFNSAFIEYTVKKPINYIHFYLGMWSNLEFISKENGLIELQYKDGEGNWITGINFFEYELPNRYNLKPFRYDFPYGTTSFRFYAESYINTTATSNKGRVVLKNLSIVYDINDSESNELLVSIISTKGNASSMLPWSGHSFCYLYNRSPKYIKIGYYSLAPFEGVTVGLFSNKKHKGVYYNFEYYERLTQIEDALSSSSSSSSSTSSYGQQTEVPYSSGGYSFGSFGVFCWMVSDYRESFFVEYFTTASSLTTSCNPEKAKDISNVLIGDNDEWWIWYNCSDMAIEIWNTVSDDKINPDFIQTPTDLVDKILSKGYSQMGITIGGNRNKVGYYENGIFHESVE